MKERTFTRDEIIRGLIVALRRLDLESEAVTTRVIGFDEGLREYRTNAMFCRKVDLVLHEIAFPPIALEASEEPILQRTFDSPDPNFLEAMKRLGNEGNGEPKI